MTTQNDAKKETAKKQIDAFMNSETTRYVDWTEGEGKAAVDHHDKITVEDPGIEYAMQAIDMLDVGDDMSDFQSLFELIMDRVIDDPVYSYSQLDKDLPAKDKAKTVHKKNRDGKDVAIKMVWPGYGKAIQLVMQTTGPSGRTRMLATLKDLNDEVLRQEDGQIVKMDYWNAGGKGSGLGMVAYQEALNYLSEILNRGGLIAKLNAGFEFLTSSVRQTEN